MGFFDKLKKSILSSGTGPKAKKFSDVYYQADVVGESFYKDSFREIRNNLGLPSNSEAQMPVDLVQDPTNEFEKSGKAVAVFISGLKVGHIDSLAAPHVWEMIDKSSGKMTITGRVYFGDLRETISKNSVQINLKYLGSTASKEASKARASASHNERLERGKKLQKDWMKNPDFSTFELMPGDKVTFAGFPSGLPTPSFELITEILGEPSKSGTHLLVVHQSNLETQRVALWLTSPKGFPITEFEIFLQSNPKFAARYDSKSRRWK